MSFLTVLKEAGEATLAAISFIQHTNSIHELLQDYTGNKRTINYIDHKTIRDLTLSENTNDIDWVEPAVDRLNIANFTMDVQSNNVQYDEAISNFFSLLIPRQLHDQQDIIDMFLDAVTTWTVAETRWPIDKHTTDVISIIKERLEDNLKGQSPSLCQRTLNAFDTRYKDLDSTALDVSILNSNERMKATWFKVLPMVLKAIDEKHNTSLYPMPDSRPAPHYQHSHQQHTNNSSRMSTSTHHTNPPSSSSSGASHYFSPINACNINSRFQEIDSRTSIHEDNNEIPDEPQTSGMKRSHNQQEADVATVDKRRRPEPVVRSEIPEEDDKESLELSSEDTYDGTLVSNPHSEYDSDANDSRENNNSSSEQQRPLNPINMLSPLAILNPNRDEPISASNASQKKGQGVVATDRVTRASSRLRASGSSDAPQQDDQGNNPSSSVSAFPSSDTSTKLRRRGRPWTKEEITALVRGIQLHGRKWAKIKAGNSYIFRDRTLDQLLYKARHIASQRVREGQPLGSFACMLPSR